MMIFCVGCDSDVKARLTDGEEIYPARADLHALPFWKCDQCGGFVGCHHKTGNRTQPLGVIPTAELKKARMRIHAIMDPMWQDDKPRRKAIYRKLSQKLGREYHTAELRNLTECSLIESVLKEMANA